MTDPIRTPYCHKIRYGITGAPILTEDEMDGTHAPGVGVDPTLIELVYHAARDWDGKPAKVSASVTGWWTRFGQREESEGKVTTHFDHGPDGWPAWLAAEARMHDPAVVRCICGHTEAQHFEDACLACDCGDYLEPAAAREVITRLAQGAESNRLALSEALGLGTGAPWDAIRERAAELAAVQPPADQAATRDRIAKVLAHSELKPPFPHCLAMADAVLGVLPEPADRAAVLREAADAVAEMDTDPNTRFAAEQLRRMADETPAAEPVPATSTPHGLARMLAGAAVLSGRHDAAPFDELPPAEREQLEAQARQLLARADEAQQPASPRCPSCGHQICDADGPCGALMRVMVSSEERCACTGPGAAGAQQDGAQP